MRRTIAPFALTTTIAFVSAACLAQPPAAPPDATGNVIFIHPDGASSATWAAGRMYFVGPDGDLNWDRLPDLALYRGHMNDVLTATSNGGATTHAFGVKVASDAFGRTAGGKRGADIVDEHGRSTSVAMQALDAGLSVGLINSGTITEPGTGCFVAFTESRYDHDRIAERILESGAAVILGGGERWFLPEGVDGRHGPGARKDGRNLIDEARASGYTVVFSRDQLLNLPADTERVLGLFASVHTFNARSEEKLAENHTPHYDPDAPTIGEMMQAALEILSRRNTRFLIVAEEEGTDNFGNHNNASGEFEAMRRADEAIGVAQKFLAAHPDTLIMTTADSDAGGMRAIGMDVEHADEPLPAHEPNGAPIDGVNGTESSPFIAAPDRNGQRLPFRIVWASPYDLSGGVLVRAAGLNSEYVRGSMDNTEVAELIRLTLFGRR